MQAILVARIFGFSNPPKKRSKRRLRRLKTGARESQFNLKRETSCVREHIQSEGGLCALDAKTLQLLLEMDQRDDVKQPYIVNNHVCQVTNTFTNNGRYTQIICTRFTPNEPVLPALPIRTKTKNPLKIKRRCRIGPKSAKRMNLSTKIKSKANRPTNESLIMYGAEGSEDIKLQHGHPDTPKVSIGEDPLLRPPLRKMSMADSHDQDDRSESAFIADMSPPQPSSDGNVAVNAHLIRHQRSNGSNGSSSASSSISTVSPLSRLSLPKVDGSGSNLVRMNTITQWDEAEMDDMVHDMRAEIQSATAINLRNPEMPILDLLRTPSVLQKTRSGPTRDIRVSMDSTVSQISGVSAVSTNQFEEDQENGLILKPLPDNVKEERRPSNLVHQGSLLGQWQMDDLEDQEKQLKRQMSMLSLLGAMDTSPTTNASTQQESIRKLSPNTQRMLSNFGDLLDGETNKGDIASSEPFASSEQSDTVSIMSNRTDNTRKLSFA